MIPVLATVGAAIFGVTVAYQAGSRSGATQTRNEIANTIEREVGEATDATEPVLATIESAAASPAGQDVYVLGAPESAPVAIPQASLAEVRQRLNRLRGIARGLRAP